MISVEQARPVAVMRQRTPAVGAGFALAPAAAPAGIVAPQRLAGAGPLLAVGATARDMAARRRAGALLAGLSALQRGLLGGRVEAGELARLPDLLEGEEGDDPELADALRAIALRARIEWERRRT